MFRINQEFHSGEINTMKGRKPAGIRKGNTTYDRGRICAESECNTQLSIYNKYDFCSLHDEKKHLPRIRGRKYTKE